MGMGVCRGGVEMADLTWQEWHKTKIQYTQQVHLSALLDHARAYSTNYKLYTSSSTLYNMPTLLHSPSADYIQVLVCP